MAHLNVANKRISDISILDAWKIIKDLASKSNHKYKSTIDTLKSCVEKMEKEIPLHMCRIMGSKPDGFVFPYLDFSDFSDVPIDKHFDLSKSQSYQLHRARTRYNGMLETIRTKLNLPYLTSHCSRHTFTYSMINIGASMEEISLCLAHSNVRITNEYLRQFPSGFADKSLDKFNDRMSKI